MRVNGKNTVAVLNLNELESHRVRSVNGILGSAGRTQSAFASKRNKFKLAAFFTAIHSTAVGRIPAVDHFLYIFHYDRSRFDNILNILVMVCKYLLKYIHAWIIS